MRRTGKLAVCARAGFLTLLGAASAWLVDIMHSSRYAVFAADFRGILEGQPYSPAFANRRLGPWSFVALDKICGSAELAQTLFVYAAGLALSWLGYLFSRRLGWTINRSLGISVSLCASFVLLQDDFWLMIWDLYDMVFFTCLAYAIFRRLAPRNMIPLFILMLLNRESALFVPLWLMIRAYLDRDRRTITMAALMGLAGVLVTVAWRLPYMGSTGLSHVGCNHFRPTANLRILMSGNNEAWLALILSAAVTILAWRTIRVSVRGRENEFRGVIEALSVAAALAMAILVIAYILLI